MGQCSLPHLWGLLCQISRQIIPSNLLPPSQRRVTASYLLHVYFPFRSASGEGMVAADYATSNGEEVAVGESFNSTSGTLTTGKIGRTFAAPIADDNVVKDNMSLSSRRTILLEALCSLHCYRDCNR